MHINYNDPVQWLSYRFTCDAEARNQGIERKFLQFFDHMPRLCLVDVGAGTGANFRYYFDKIKQNQEWTFIEQNPHLIRASHICLEKFALHHDYGFHQNNDTITITAGNKKAHIKLIQGTLQHIEELTDLEEIDVVTANAVFDLVPFEHFDTFVGKLKAKDVCLLSTLNYYETSFIPFSESDGRFIRLYHMHMRRPQPFGIAMGPDCCEEMLDLLHQHQMLIEQEGSQWHITRRNTTMQHFLLHFIENAIHELNLADCEQKAFNEWITEKKELCHKRELEIYVDHNDIFAYP